MRALFDSIVRTLTPIIVGAVVGWIATAGIALDPEFEAALTIVIAGAFSGMYYIAVRLLETYVTPKFGWLLGLAKAPNYVPPVEPERIHLQLDATEIARAMNEARRAAVAASESLEETFSAAAQSVQDTAPKD